MAPALIFAADIFPTFVSTSGHHVNLYRRPGYFRISA
jgi:hypothetical protein